MMLTLSAFREGDNTNQLQGTVFLKTEPKQTVQQMMNAFCRWSNIPASKCVLVFGDQQPEPTARVGETGLKSGCPVIAYFARDAPEPSAAARSTGFTIVDVMDSEMADLLGGSGL